jgi:hypothetical protein
LKIQSISGALTLLAVSLVHLQSSTAEAQVTAFTYQGRLSDGAGPANGLYDFRFSVFDASVSGNQVGPSRTNNATQVTNGGFQATLDFGNIFNGANYWLDVAVRTNGTTADFSPLAPRQALLPVPYAMFANTASNLSGTISSSALPSSPSFQGTVTAGFFSGSGAALTSLVANNISVGTLDDQRLSANVALLNRDGQQFTGSQIFNNALILNSANGFSQSSLGAFTIDSPSTPGGRFTVLDNGNVGIGISNPVQKFQVAGDTLLTGNNFFGASTRQMLNLWGVQYGIGVQSLTTYFRTDNADPHNGFSWFSGGAHSDNQNDPGTGGTELMRLTSAGLTVNGALKLASPAKINVGLSPLLYSDTNENFFAGQGAGTNNTTGKYNTVVGYLALYNNTNGGWNTAIGDQALHNNTSGSDNTAVGYWALYGYEASDGAGVNNTAIGYEALVSNDDGRENTAVGVGALGDNINGNDNIAIGYSAGQQITGNNNIDIGNSGVSGDSSTMRIGGSQTKTFISGISGTTIPNGVPVFVNSSGQLGAVTSSARFKQNIRSMGDESSVLLSMRPVAFQYKTEIDSQGTPQFGLIAEEVDKVAPGLVARDDQNRIFSVRYEAVNAMLLNEFLKEHRKVTEQEAQLKTMKQETDLLIKRLSALENAVAHLVESK